MKEAAVYLFLGFLESGKTKFIQETFEDKRMDNGEKTMLLVCEEGEEEYAPERFKVRNVAIEYIDDEADLNGETLSALAEKHGAERIIVEYNGAWMLQSFFEAMPDGWMVNQMMTFFDAGTFLNYNKNMRQLVYDKVQMTGMVVFNRFKGEYDKMEFHKIIRAISKRTDIVYDYLGGKPELDEIEDPLPFDVNAPVIEIEDRDFALFYRDIAEKTNEYVGKTVRFKGMATKQKKLASGQITMGREIMICCEADIAYYGFVIECGDEAKKIKEDDWLYVTGKIALKKTAVYRSAGPVILAAELKKASPPEQEVATFY